MENAVTAQLTTDIASTKGHPLMLCTYFGLAVAECPDKESMFKRD